MSRALSGIRGMVHAQLRGCGLPLMDQKILEAAIEFCRTTAVMRLELDPIYIHADVADYDLDGWDTDQEDISLVLKVWQDDSLLTPITDYEMPEPRLLRLVNTPAEDITDGLVVLVALVPITTATTLQDFVYDRYAMDISDGVLHKLMEMPDMPWSNAQLAAYHYQRFQAAISNAKGDAMREFTNAIRGFQPRSFI